MFLVFSDELRVTLRTYENTPWHVHLDVRGELLDRFEGEILAIATLIRELIAAASLHHRGMAFHVLVEFVLIGYDGLAETTFVVSGRYVRSDVRF